MPLVGKLTFRSDQPCTVKIKPLAMALTVLSVLVGACTEDSMTSERMRSMIDKELQHGVDSHEIEAFFRRHDLPFSYDQYAKKYQSIVRNVSRVTDRAIVIYIYVDSDKKFVKREV